MSRDRKHYHVVVLGARGVGKSALIQRFVLNLLGSCHEPSLSSEAYRRELDVDGAKVLLEVLDIPWAELSAAYNTPDIRFSQGFVLVFSLTEETSTRVVDDCLQQLYHIKGGDTTVPIVIAGTKLDLVYEREVSRHTVRSVARWNIPFYETSALYDWHVAGVFQDLAKRMLVRFPDDPKPSIKPTSKRSTWLRRQCTVM